MAIPASIRAIDDLPVIVALLAALDAAQDRQRRSKRGKCFQLPSTTGGVPPVVTAPAKIAAARKAFRLTTNYRDETVPDGVDAKGLPKTKVQRKPDPNWADFLGTDDPALPCDVEVHEYESSPPGYVVILTAKNGGGKVYRRVINRGPEKDRAMAWAEAQPKP